MRPFEDDGLSCRVQVLQERGESTSRHGRATFSVLLFQVWIFFSVLPKLEWLWLWIDLKDLDP